LRSIGFVSSSFEELVALLFGEEIADVSDGLLELVVGPGCGFSDQGFELGECHLDWVEIGEYGGRNRNHAPMSFTIAAAFRPRWVARLSTPPDE
jgi:hypothetical protein